MRCPSCGQTETRVVDSRDQDEGATIRRRRECTACGTRFTTFERSEAARLTVLKRDGARQEFDADKLAEASPRPSPAGPCRPMRPSGRPRRSRLASGKQA